MILLLGLSGDGPLHAISSSLDRGGTAYRFVDQRAIADTEVELREAASGCIKTGSGSFDLSSVTAVYLRRYDWRRLDPIASAGYGSKEWFHAASVEEALNCWVETTEALVLNRPSAMASNGSKPYQASIIRQCGFSIPDTLVTTDASAVLDFRARHGTLIYKSISGVRSIVSKLTDEHLGRLEDLAWCPTQFQQYIPGRDYRVHVVGDETFACEIITDADDYRYAGRQNADVEIRSCDLPAHVIERARAASKRLGLVFGGVDLRRTPEDEWYCFEVNPSPAFTFYESHSGQPIADAVASLLRRASAQAN